jgi:hypothetical protein
MYQDEPGIKPTSEIHRVFVVIEVLAGLILKLDGSLHLTSFEELSYVGGNGLLERFKHALDAPSFGEP